MFIICKWLVQKDFTIISRFVCCGCYMKTNVAFALISFAVLKWDDCLSVQLPFELLVKIPVQLLLELEANCLDQNVNELECRWNNLRCVFKLRNKLNSLGKEDFQKKNGWQFLESSFCDFIKSVFWTTEALLCLDLQKIIKSQLFCLSRLKAGLSLTVQLAWVTLVTILKTF